MILLTCRLFNYIEVPECARVLQISPMKNRLCFLILVEHRVGQFRTHKVIYRRYAGLFFSMCVDITDNELAYLESIHLFVEILDHFFSNVCELDLVFNFHKVLLHHCVLLQHENCICLFPYDDSHSRWTASCLSKVCSKVV